MIDAVGTIPSEPAKALRRIRIVLTLFIAGLVVSGVTAFSLLSELETLGRWLRVDDAAGSMLPDTLRFWLVTVRAGLRATAGSYPWLFYGTDWLAFGHLVIALFFLPAWRDPARNVAALRMGLWACAGVLPLALICGPARGIPFFWRLVDCSFGVFGALPLLYCLRQVQRLVPTFAGSPRPPRGA